MPDRRSKGLILLFLISLLIRSAWVLFNLHGNPGEAFNADTPSYMRPAIALLQDHRFSVISGSKRPEFFRTPGYPLFLAICFSIFGQNFLAVCLIQAIFSAGTVVLTYLLAEQLWPPKTAWIAAVFVLLEPLQTNYTTLILTETVSTLLLTLVAYLGVWVLQQDRETPWACFSMGIALAIAIMVRPGNYYLGSLIPLVLLCKIIKNPGSWKLVLLSVLLFLIPLVFIVGGWKLRNHFAVDSWRMSYVDSQSLYLTRAAGILAQMEGIDIKDARNRLQKQFGNRKKTESIGSYYERMRQEGLKIIREHPFENIPMTFEGARQFFDGFPYLYILDRIGFFRNDLTKALSRYFLFLCYLFTIIGIVISIQSGNRMAHSFLLLIALYIIAISATNPLAYARYRAPIMPILCLYTAASVSWFYSKIQTVNR